MYPPSDVMFKEGRPVVIRDARSYDFTSAITGGDYRILVYVPEARAPEGGFATFYILDGGAWFGTVVEAVRSRMLGNEIVPAVVVGIGYQADDLRTAGKLRFGDLTLPTGRDWLDSLAYKIPGLTAEMTGGAAAFLEMIEREVKPAVRRLAPINPSYESLFGHSLGGLTVLQALFSAPRSYRSFIASSPSIWWADSAILESEPGFAAVAREGQAQPRILIEVGGLEQTGSRAALRFFQSETLMNASLARSRMVDNADQLGRRLATLRGGPEYKAETVIFPGEGHGSVVAAALGRAVSFALEYE